MKIGILTLPIKTNYGGILQAFALQHTLIKLGYDAITINRHNRQEYPSLMIHLAGYCKRLIQHYLQGKKLVSIKWNPFISEEDYLSSSSETQKFIDRNIKLTRRVFSDELEKIEDDYHFDAYIVGSDQVWLEYYCPESFLSFVHRTDVKRVCYAASCGKRSFFCNEDKVGICQKLAQLFDGVSVREDYLVPLCEKKLGIEAQWVLDPTLLLEPKEYIDASICSVDKEPILFSYILDANDEKRKIVQSVADMLNVPVVNGNRIDEVNKAGKVYPSVDDWLQNINRSKFVITDSFHGTVFSILFNKPFLSIGNAKRGMARFQSLLGRFGLNDRLILNVESDDYLSVVHNTIDFAMINKTIVEERKKSLNFLLKSLNRDNVRK